MTTTCFVPRGLTSSVTALCFAAHPSLRPPRAPGLSFPFRPVPSSQLLTHHRRLVSIGRRPFATAVPTASTTSPARAPSPSASAAPLPLVYQHDRSSYYRRLTIAAAASLCVVWLPLCYVSLVMASPPLYATLLGPLAAVATLIATHFRARRIIRTLHRAPAGLLVHTYTALGQPHSIGIIPYNNINQLNSGTSSSSTSSSSSSSKPYWIITLQGYKRYFLIDKQGEVVDRDSMRRVVGYDELESEEERAKKQRDGIRGPGTLGRLQKR